MTKVVESKPLTRLQPDSGFDGCGVNLVSAMMLALSGVVRGDYLCHPEAAYSASFLRQLGKCLVGLLTSAVRVLVHALKITPSCNNIGMAQTARDFLHSCLAALVEERRIR